jgi:hypothetical protein
VSNGADTRRGAAENLLIATGVFGKEEDDHAI